MALPKRFVVHCIVFHLVIKFKRVYIPTNIGLLLGQRTKIRVFNHFKYGMKSRSVLCALICIVFVVGDSRHMNKHTRFLYNVHASSIAFVRFYIKTNSEQTRLSYRFSGQHLPYTHTRAHTLSKHDCNNRRKTS